MRATIQSVESYLGWRRSRCSWQDAITRLNRYLLITGNDPVSLRSPEAQVPGKLAGGPVLTRAKLRESLAMKNERLGKALDPLERAGRLHRTATGWQRPD
jgi:hypothetical protein